MIAIFHYVCRKVSISNSSMTQRSKSKNRLARPYEDIGKRMFMVYSVILILKKEKN